MILKKVIWLHDEFHPKGAWYYHLSDEDEIQGPFETASEAKTAMADEARFKKIELWPY